MGHRQHHVLVHERLPGFKSRKRTGVDHSRKVILFVQRVTAKELGLVADVEVHAGKIHYRVLRVAATGVTRRVVRNEVHDWDAGRNRGKQRTRSEPKLAAGHSAQHLQIWTKFSVSCVECLGSRSGVGQERRVQNLRKLRALTTYANPLGVIEEDQLVLDDGAADGTAELVTCKYGLGNVVCRVVVSVRGQRRNTVEFIRCTMELVGARLRGDVYHTAGAAAVFRRHAIGDDTKFLH